MIKELMHDPEFLSIVSEKADKNDIRDVIVTYTDGTRLKFKNKPFNVTRTSLN